MNYLRIHGLTKDELQELKTMVENVMNDYDDGSAIKVKLQEDYWDLLDEINRNEDAA